MKMLACVVAATVVVAANAGAQQGERISFTSRTPSGPSEMMSGGGAEVTLTGRLNVPHGGAPRPAMVLSHGSGGILDGREHEWAARLNALGVATLVVDSFTPRGLAATGEDQTRLSLAASVVDAFAALDLLSRLPAIDRTRIGVMGFSKGGQVALYSALEPFRRGALRGDGLRFALHIALYPSCSIPYRSREVTGAPMVFLLGGADDYTPAAHCMRYADYFRARDAPVVTATFSGAHHGFDVPTRPQLLSRVQTARNCGLDIELEPVVGRRWEGGEEVAASDIPAYLRGCMQRGATFGGNAAALAESVRHVSDAVRRHLKPE
jgi:dienelactone hydrolase